MEPSPHRGDETREQLIEYYRIRGTPGSTPENSADEVLSLRLARQLQNANRGLAGIPVLLERGERLGRALDAVGDPFAVVAGGGRPIRRRGGPAGGGGGGPAGGGGGPAGGGGGGGGGGPAGLLVNEHNPHLECPIHLEILGTNGQPSPNNHPITTVCGHSFCRGCLLHSWDTGNHECPSCRRQIARPSVEVLEINNALAGLVTEILTARGQPVPNFGAGGHIVPRVIWPGPNGITRDALLIQLRNLWRDIRNLRQIWSRNNISIEEPSSVLILLILVFIEFLLVMSAWTLYTRVVGGTSKYLGEKITGYGTWDRDYEGSMLFLTKMFQIIELPIFAGLLGNKLLHLPPRARTRKRKQRNRLTRKNRS